MGADSRRARSRSPRPWQCSTDVERRRPALNLSYGFPLGHAVSLLRPPDEESDGAASSDESTYTWPRSYSLESPPAVDPPMDPRHFKERVLEKVDKWRQTMFKQQYTRPHPHDKGKVHIPDPTYFINFDNPMYNVEKSSVTYTILRQDLFILSLLSS